MLFQENNDEYYDNILDHLRFSIPEFVSIFEDEFGAYPILGDFGIYIIENVKNKEIFLKCVSFINEAILEGKCKTEDVIVLQIFQRIYENFSISEIVKLSLNEKARILFETYQIEFNKTQ